MTNGNRVFWVLGLVLASLVLAEAMFAPHHHPIFAWHRWPGFLALLGLVSCLVVVKLSKWLGKKFLQWPEEFDV